MPLPKINNAPQYAITVPSTKQKISLRPFLVGEQKALTLALSTEDNSTIIQSIKNIIEVCSDGKIDTTNMPACDTEYLFMQLRAKSIGENVDLLVTCGGDDCEEQLEFSLDISLLEPDFSLVKPQKIQLTDSIGVMLRYPSMEEDVYLRENYNEQTLFDVVVNCISAVWNMEEYVDVCDVTRDEVVVFVESLTVSQLQKLVEFIECSPYIHFNTEIVCPSCGCTNQIRLRGLENFFA